MTIFTRRRDAEAYIQRLESIVIAMATDISNLLNTNTVNLRSYTAQEIIDDYSLVVSEPSVFEEVLHEEYDMPYLERKSTLADLIEMGAAIQCYYSK